MRSSRLVVFVQPINRVSMFHIFQFFSSIFSSSFLLSIDFCCCCSCSSSVQTRDLCQIFFLFVLKLLGIFRLLFPKWCMISFSFSSSVQFFSFDWWHPFCFKPSIDNYFTFVMDFIYILLHLILYICIQHNNSKCTCVCTWLTSLHQWLNNIRQFIHFNFIFLLVDLFRCMCVQYFIVCLAQTAASSLVSYFLKDHHCSMIQI